MDLREDRFGLDWAFESVPERAPTVLVHGEVLVPMGAFVRMNPDPAVPAELGLDADGGAIYSQERRAAIHALLETLECTVVNRPSGGRANASKPYQMSRLEAAGFRVPAWVATNEPKEVARFLRGAGGDAIVKSCSGLRCHVRRLDDATLERLSEGTAPVVCQTFVPGFDVRVHVVGERTFSTAVTASVVDYRFDTEEASFRAFDPPDAIAEKCRAHAAQEGLILAGFDFRVDPSGAWWCLEMNPVPTFLPYEAGSGHPIGDAVLDLLVPETASAITASPLTRHFSHAAPESDQAPMTC